MTDAQALETFEALVLSQKPASEPWGPVTPFDYESRKAVEGKHPELIWTHLISCEDADVLDYGCGPDAHLVRLLDEYRAAHDPGSQVAVWGYDPQVRSEMARTSQQKPEIRPIWDLVICREVCEHCTIREIRWLVSDLCGLSAGLVYVTTRFHLAPQHLLDVMTSDDLDPTHITMLNQDFLRVLFVLEGFRRRRDLETAMDWQGKGRCLVYERAA